VQVFGRARPRGRTPTDIQILQNNRLRRTVTASGYFLATLRGSPNGKWQLSWSDGTTTYVSRVAKALPDPPKSAR
jgi:hypothetical protein